MSRLSPQKQKRTLLRINNQHPEDTAKDDLEIYEPLTGQPFDVV